MAIIPTLFLGLLLFFFDILAASVQILHQWISGCLISFVILASVIGGVAGLIVLGSFIFNL